MNKVDAVVRKRNLASLELLHSENRMHNMLVQNYKQPSGMEINKRGTHTQTNN